MLFNNKNQELGSGRLTDGKIQCHFYHARSSAPVGTPVRLDSALC